MMTPQEVSSHAFSKAALGGYNMAMVDEFLDLLTEDYTALYNDNAILKNKLKVLSDTVEEYRATDDAMRKTLLAAQQMAESIVKDAEEKKASLLKDAESAAQKQIDDLRMEVAAEQYRLKTAKEETAAYVAKVSKLFEAQELVLRELDKLTPPASQEKLEAAVDKAAQDIENSMGERLAKEAAAQEPAKPAEKGEEPAGESAAPAEQAEPPREAAAVAAGSARRGVIDLEATRRFENLEFGKDYEIR